MQHVEGIYKAIADGCFAQPQLGTNLCPSVPSNLDCAVILIWIQIKKGMVFNMELITKFEHSMT
jgi:hypothetical protein